MKIIAVNIKETINDIGPEKATHRAWKLSKSNAEKRDFVIGFNKMGYKYDFYYYALLSVEQDHEHQDRVKFNLEPIEKEGQIGRQITQYISGKKFDHITVAYLKPVTLLNK